MDEGCPLQDCLMGAPGGQEGMEGVQKKLGGKLLKRYHKNWERIDGVEKFQVGKLWAVGSMESNYGHEYKITIPNTQTTKPNHVVLEFTNRNCLG